MEGDSREGSTKGGNELF